VKYNPFLGPCGHSITNIGTKGCAICVAGWAPVEGRKPYLPEPEVKKPRKADR
jgi:hypothetical protein